MLTKIDGLGEEIHSYLLKNGDVNENQDLFAINDLFCQIETLDKNDIDYSVINSAIYENISGRSKGNPNLIFEKLLDVLNRYNILCNKSNTTKYTPFIYSKDYETDTKYISALTATDSNIKIYSFDDKGECTSVDDKGKEIKINNFPDRVEKAKYKILISKMSTDTKLSEQIFNNKILKKIISHLNPSNLHRKQFGYYIGFIFAGLFLIILIKIMKGIFN